LGLGSVNQGRSEVRARHAPRSSKDFRSISTGFINVPVVIAFQTSQECVAEAAAEVRKMGARSAFQSASQAIQWLAILLEAKDSI
jgi:hypothetical protein